MSIINWIRTQTYNYSKKLFTLRGLSLYSILLLSFLNIYGIILLKGADYLSYEHILPSSIATLTWATLTPLLIAIIPSKLIRDSLKYLAYIIISLTFIVESYVLCIYKSILSDSIILAITESNIQESLEFIHSISLPEPIFFCFFYLLISLFLTLHFFKGSSTKRLKTIPFLILCLTTIGFYPSEVYDAAKRGFESGYPDYIEMSSFERIYWGAKTCQKEVATMQELFDKINKSEIKGLTISKDFGEHSIILIQGESLNRNYMSCYGYKEKTTPKLDSLIAEGKLYLFNNVLAPAPNTSASLPRVYSLYLNQQTKKHWYELPVIFNILNQAGYYTHWLSNQESVGLWLNSVAAISRLCKSQNYIRKTTSRDWWSKQTNYDGALLPKLARREDFKAEKFFELIHLMGNHGEYAERYPKKFEVFTAKDITDNRLKQRQKQGRAEYLNSILYNDYIVSEIIKFYKQEKAIIIYFSDHGCIVYDDEENLSFCGHSSKKGGLEIPFMMYLTPKMKQAQPELEELIKEAQSKAFMTDAFPESLLGLLGIELADYPRSQTNLFSPSYDETRERKFEW